MKKSRKIKAKIIGCTRDLESEPKCWYKDKIGDTILVYKCSNKNIRLCNYREGAIGKINVVDLQFL